MKRRSSLLLSLVDPDKPWLSHATSQEIASLVRNYCGILINLDNPNYLPPIVESFKAKRNLSSDDDVISILKSDSGALNEFVQLCTINESYLFRDRTLFEIFAKHVLPQKMATGKSLTIWSAAASTGDEAVTIGILCSEVAKHIDCNWRVYGTDIDVQAIAKAKQGLFELRKLKGVPNSILHQYFDQRGDTWLCKPTVLDHLKFFEFNLVGPDEVSIDCQIDVVFLRNVMIYFDLPTRARVLEMIHSKMSPDGILCLGHAETISEDDHLFAKEIFEKVVLYRKKTTP
jgi:chemotaxis protein methyltransferase CheR